MRLFDAHGHLQDPRLLTRADEVIRDARSAGVERILCCGICEGDWADVLHLSRLHPEVVPSFGLHPWFVPDRTPEWREALLTYLRQGPAAIGEIGLDRNKPQPEIQEEAFLWQLQLAKELKLPVSIHCCKAWGRIVDLIEDIGGLAPGFVLHSYSGGAELVGRLAKRGAYFSFSGTITRPGDKRGARAAAAVPPDRLLAETDAPYLPPLLDDGQAPDLNTPAHLPVVIRKLAEVRKTSEAEVAATTWDNAMRLFAACKP